MLLLWATLSCINHSIIELHVIKSMHLKKRQQLKINKKIKEYTMLDKTDYILCKNDEKLNNKYKITWFFFIDITHHNFSHLISFNQ